MSKNNSLVEIAKVLIEMKEERQLIGVPKSIMSRYPEGSEAIVIEDNQYIVLNSKETNEVKETDKVNSLKESNLKYNLNFFYGTYKSKEPDIIDETHNKSKLINEAYTEVSFLPKDIYSQAEFNAEDGKQAVKTIIDRTSLSEKDFEDYRVSNSSYSKSDSYDEVYRCRCVFTDISGNESIESILIKAFKVSNRKNEEYSYNIVNSENIKEQVEELEKKVENDTSGEMRSVYSKISANEYNNIISHIKEGIEKYYQENSKKYYRLTRVDIKAIYCLRLKKIPIELKLLVNNSNKATYSTYYSMVAGNFNVFTCPNCNELSGSANSYNSMKIHIDHDFIDTEEESMLMSKSPIGCTSCMEYCNRCGSWHFKLKEYNNIISKGFYPIDKRKFLSNYAEKDIKTEDLCSCKEYLTWIYDEMSLTKINVKSYYTKIVDRFLSSSCKLVFVNYLTGEQIATYSDYIEYLYVFLHVYLKKNQKVMKAIVELEKNNKKEIATLVYSFIDLYRVNEKNDYSDLKLEKYIRQSIEDFKKSLADMLNITPSNVKCTNSNNMIQCSCCNGYYYNGVNTEKELYYNEVKKSCCCCAEASQNGLKMWNRIDDNVTFYKSKNRDTAIRTFKSKSGEIIFEDWKKDMIKMILKNLHKKA